MDPISLAASALLAQVDWKKVLKGLATDSASKGAKSLLAHLKPDDRDKTAKQAIGLFVQEFLTELEDKTPLSIAIPGYKDQLKRLIEHAAPDITVWLQPETKDVDLGPVQRMWDGLGLTPLPEDFDWTLLSKSYLRDIRKYVKSDPALREILNTALLEQQTELQQKSQESLARMAGPDPGFDLIGYRDYLRQKCEVLQFRRCTPARTIAASICGPFSFRSPPVNPPQHETSRASFCGAFAKKGTSQLSMTKLKWRDCVKRMRAVPLVPSWTSSNATAWWSCWVIPAPARRRS